MYSYKLKNNVCVISIFHLYEAKKLNKKNWLVKSYCGRWSNKLTSALGVDYCDVFISCWMLVLTAPIHRSGSTAEQVMNATLLQI